MDRVLLATEDPVEGYGRANHIRVEKLPTPIVQGQPLPKPLNEWYRFRMEPEPTGGCYLFSLSNIFPDTVVQGGCHVPGVHKDVPNMNYFVNIHERQRIICELFWFENNPTKL